jgi:hypothetical protein
VPYQLHCCTQLALVDEELTDDGVADLDDEDIDEGVADLDEEDTDEGTEDAAEPPEQTEPFTVGRSSAPPFLFNWKPKLTVWPGGIVAFQPKLVAV